MASPLPPRPAPEGVSPGALNFSSPSGRYLRYRSYTSSSFQLTWQCRWRQPRSGDRRGFASVCRRRRFGSRVTTRPSRTSDPSRSRAAAGPAAPAPSRGPGHRQRHRERHGVVLVIVRYMASTDGLHQVCRYRQAARILLSVSGGHGQVQPPPPRDLESH